MEILTSIKLIISLILNNIEVLVSFNFIDLLVTMD